LKVGTNVRLILPKKKLNKTRYNVSPVYYKISDKEGISYIIQAKDGTTKTVSRFQIIPVADNTNLKFGSSLSEGNVADRGEVVEIMKYYPKKEKYHVKFEMPDGSDYYDTIPVSYLRQKHPLRKTQIELEYFSKH